MPTTRPIAKSQVEPRRHAAEALVVLIQYDAQAHGPALAFYRGLRDELNRMHRAAGGRGVRLGVAAPLMDARGAPTGRISIPVTPLDPDDPATAMNELAKALLARDGALPGVLDVRRRAA
jgi:hypothetical protein